MGTTIADVAKRAGVSIATVSRVINNKVKVDIHTREKVVKAIQELNYVPNLMARGLMLNQTNTVGVFLPDIGGHFYSGIISGIDDTANHQKYHILLNRIRETSGTYQQVMQLTNEGRVDGLIIMSPTITEIEIQKLGESQYPVVLIDSWKESKYMDSIRVNNYYGAREMTEHLVKHHQYQRIAFIGGPINEPDTRLRLDGFKSTLDYYHLPLIDEYIMDGDFSVSTGYKCLGKLLTSKVRPPEAVFCANDEIAKGAMDAVLEKGIAVPKDIAVVGFDDVEFAKHLRPALTTVRQPIYQMGCIAMQKLFHAIENRHQENEIILLPTELMIRESCGCKTNVKN